MKLLLAVLLLLASASAPAADECAVLLPEKWNRFAEQANRYVAQLQGGVKDVRLQAKVERDWRGLTGCGCW